MNFSFSEFSLSLSVNFIPKVRINNIPAFGSYIGLAPTQQQVIIWTNEGYFTDAYMRRSASVINIL